MSDEGTYTKRWVMPLPPEKFFEGRVTSILILQTVSRPLINEALLFAHNFLFARFVIL
jgi:hypothetical protein